MSNYLHWTYSLLTLPPPRLGDTVSLLSFVVGETEAEGQGLTVLGWPLEDQSLAVGVY